MERGYFSSKIILSIFPFYTLVGILGYLYFPIYQGKIWVLGVLFAVLILLFFFYLTKSSILLALLFVSLGVFSISYKMYSLQGFSITGYTSVNKAKAIVKKIVNTNRNKIIYLTDITSLSFKGNTLSEARMSLKSKVVLKRGDIIDFSAKFYELPKNNVIGSFDVQRYFYLQGIKAIGYINKISNIIPTTTTIYDNFFSIWRAKIRHKIIKYVKNKDVAAIILALSISNKHYVKKEILKNFSYSGIRHVISISGLHMAILSFFIFLIFRKLLALSRFISLKINPKKISIIITIFVAGLYTCLVGFNVPTIRSYFMLLIYGIAMLMNRDVFNLRILLLIMFFFLILYPASAINVGFYMSFFAVASLISFYKHFKRKYKRRLTSKVFFYAISLILTSAVATIATIPFTIYSFGFASIYSPITNFLVIPLIGFIVMPLIFMFMILVYVPHITFLLYIISPFVKFTIWIAGIISALPYSVVTFHHIYYPVAVLFITGMIIFIFIRGIFFKKLAILLMSIACLSYIIIPLPNMIIGRNIIAIKGKQGDINYYKTSNAYGSKYTISAINLYYGIKNIKIRPALCGKTCTIGDKVIYIRNINGFNYSNNSKQSRFSVILYRSANPLLHQGFIQPKYIKMGSPHLLYFWRNRIELTNERKIKPR